MTILTKAATAAAGLALASLLAAAPVRAAQPSSCKYVNIGTLPLEFVGRNFQPTVTGSVNNTPATLLVDTGAQNSSLTTQTVDRLNLSQRITGQHTQGIGGYSRLYNTRVSEFGIGPSHSKGLTINVIGDMGSVPEFDGIVGADFLFQADIEISLGEKAVRFFRPLDCKDDSFLAYWAQDAVVVPLTGNFGRSRNNTFTVELNGVKFDAIIDTGASRSIVFERAARKAGVQADHASSRKAGNLVGVGTDITTTRSAVFTTFAIGGETVRDAELWIAPDSSSPSNNADVMLGADFLRSHRILFAMSQRQLYVSYLGGEVFARDSHGIPEWLQKEADSGNPDAQFAVAIRFAEGKVVARDLDKATALLEQAAAKNHRPAMLLLANQRMRSRRYPEAVDLYTRALAAHPDDRRLWLQLFVAKLRAGQEEQARTELAARMAADSKPAWPAPVGDYYLGRIDAPALLALAAKADDGGTLRACDANNFMAMLATARGDSALVKSLSEERSRQCRPAAG